MATFRPEEPLERRLAFVRTRLRDWESRGLLDPDSVDRLEADLERQRQALLPPPIAARPVVPLPAPIVETPGALPAVPTRVEPEPELEEDSSPTALARWLDSFSNTELSRISSETVLWLVGVLLVLAGSLYFTRVNWSFWSATTRSLIVSSGLLGYAFAFLGLSTLVSRRDESELPGRVLATIPLGLAPITAFAIARFAGHGGHWAIAIPLAMASTVAAVLAATKLRGSHSPTLTVTTSITVIAIALTSGPLASTPKLAFFTLFVALFATAVAGVRIARSGSSGASTGRWLVLAPLYFGAALAAVWIQLVGLEDGPWPIGPVLGLLALSVHVAGAPKRASTRIAIIVMAALAAIIVSTGPIALVFVRVVVLLTMLLASAAAIGRAWVDDRRLPWLLGLSLGLFVYFFVPAPFTALIDLVLSASKQALGYDDRPLPVAYYGLTFIPYLGAVLYGAFRLERAGRAQLAKVTEQWLLLVALGLLLMAFTALPDERPIALSFPLYGVCFGLLSRKPGRAWLAALSQATIGVAFAVGFVRWLPLGPRPELTAFALAGFALLAPTIDRLLAGRPSRFGAIFALIAAALAVGIALPNAIEHRSFLAGGAALLAGAAGLQVGWARRDRVLIGLALFVLGLSPWLALPNVDPFWCLVVESVLLFLLGTIPTALARGADHPLAAPARHLGALGALGVLVVAFTMLSETGLLLRMGLSAALLVFAAWTTRLPAWLLPASAAAAMASIELFDAVHLPEPWALFALAGVASGLARLGEHSGMKTEEGRSWARPLRACALGLLLASVVSVLLDRPSHTLSYFLLTATASLVLRATGRQIALVIALAGGMVGLHSATNQLWPLADPAGPRLHAALFIALAHGLLFAATGFAAWHKRYAEGGRLPGLPSPRVPIVLASMMGLAAFAAQLAFLSFEPRGIIWADLLIALGAVGLGARIVRHDVTRARSSTEMLHAALLFGTAAMTASCVLGPEMLAVGIAAGSALMMLRARIRPNPPTDLARTIAVVLGSSTAVGLTGMSTATPATPWVLGLTAIAAGLAFLERPSGARLSIVNLLAALAATYGVWTASALGWLSGPAIGRLPELGFVFLLFAWLLHRLARATAQDPDGAARWLGEWSAEALEQKILRPARLWSRMFYFASFSVALADGAVLRASSGASHLLLYALFTVLLAVSVGAARRTGQARYAVVAEIILACMWIKLKSKVAWLAELESIDALVMIGATFFFTGVYAVARRAQGAEAFARSARITAVILPFAALLTLPFEPSWANAALTLAASGVYGILSKIRISRWAAPLAAVCFNLAALAALAQTNAHDPQLYVLPWSASVLALAQIYRAELSTRALGNLRMLALGATYLAGFISVLSFDSPSHSLLMACVSVAGILLGVVLRIRSYLILGAAFLVVDLGTNLARFGLSGQTGATVVLTGLGFGILAMMITWSINRRRLESLVARLFGELAGWPV